MSVKSIIATLLLMSCVSVAQAGLIFEAQLSGAQEVPPVITDAFGNATFELDNAQTALDFELSAFDITGIFGAHLHLGPVGANGPIVAFLFNPPAPTGAINGVLSSGTILQSNLIGAFAGDFSGFVASLAAGEIYVNVHTLNNPSGEIRGQVTAVPVPATIFLLLLSLGGLTLPARYRPGT